MPDSLIKAENITKTFTVGVQKVSVLKNVSLNVYAGDFLIIFGPSGSGKSTLLHTLLGLEAPSSGSVFFEEKDIYRASSEDDRAEYRKRFIGMVYQQPNWIKALSVVENVAFPLALIGVKKADALQHAWKQLEKLNMQNWVNYIPTELSSGQQQKVALARALIIDPAILIADEPTGNLDYDSGQELLDLFTNLNKDGKTLVMVTHDLEYLKYAKTAVQIFDGQLVKKYTEEEKKTLSNSVKTKRGQELGIKG